MNLSKKILALVLALLMLCGALVSCGGDGEVERGTTSGSDVTSAPTGDSQETVELYFDMVDASGNVCYIVYPNGASDEVVDLANKTATRLKTLLGKKLPTVICETEISSHPGTYICIGQVNTVETIAFLKELKYADYGFKVIAQNLISVTAHSEELLAESVKLFWNTFSKSITDAKPLSDGTTENGGRYYPAADSKVRAGEYNISALTLDGVEASKYTLVYATDDDKAAALAIKDAIGKATGVVLPIVTAGTPEVANEILVGATDRAASKKYEATAQHNYQIAVESGKMVVVAPNEIMMGIAADYVKNTLLAAEGSSKALALTAENNVLGTTTLESFDLLAKDEGDLRILSSNVYFESQTRERAETFLKTIPLYDADVICLQEMDAMWHLLIDEGIAKLGYTVVPTKGSGEYANKKNNENFTPIHYRADKYDLIDYGYQPYASVKDTKQNIFTKYPELASMSDKQKANVLKEYIKNGTEYGCVGHLSKSLTWAVFKSKTTGEQFGVISTHLTHDNSATVANLRRIYDAKELVERINTIKSKYNVPVMSVGDYNINSNETPYSVIKNGGLTDAIRSAEFKDIFYTGHELGEMPTMTGLPIDMCFHTEGVDANKLQLVVNEYTIAYTDHIPLVFDFKLDK